MRIKYMKQIGQREEKLRLSERDTSTTTVVMGTEIISVLVHGTGEPTISIDDPRRNRGMADTLRITKTIIKK